MLPGLDLYYADPAQPLTTEGEELLRSIIDDLDDDLSDLLVFALSGPWSRYLEKEKCGLVTRLLL